MKTASILLVAALAAGCVMNPAEIRQASVPTEIAMQRAPMGAAACVARNVEKTADIWLGANPTNIREGEKPGTAELTVLPTLIADFTPSGTGSTAKIYFSPNALSVFIERYTGAFKGC